MQKRKGLTEIFSRFETNEVAEKRRKEKRDNLALEREQQKERDEAEQREGLDLLQQEMDDAVINRNIGAVPAGGGGGGDALQTVVDGKL